MAIAFLVIIVFRRVIIPGFMKDWHTKIKLFVEEMEKDPNLLPKTKKESVEQLYLVEKRKKLEFITIWVSRIEMVVFIVLTISILHKPLPLLEGAKTFGAFLGGWLAIKILTSHGPWSDKVVGKAYYHQSLIGTLLNVLAGLISGYFIYLAF